MWDPKTKVLTPIDTCFSWGHINFDDNDVLWSSFGPAGVEGWFDVKTWDKTHDEKASQGWSGFILDNNGNGKRDAYTEPNQPTDPAKDHRLSVQYYGDSPAPDGSTWAVGWYIEPATELHKTLIEQRVKGVWSLVPSPNPSSEENGLAGITAIPGGGLWSVGIRTSKAGNPATLVEFHP